MAISLDRQVTGSTRSYSTLSDIFYVSSLLYTTRELEVCGDLVSSMSVQLIIAVAACPTSQHHLALGMVPHSLTRT